jgi:hypothetical protein
MTTVAWVIAGVALGAMLVFMAWWASGSGWD